jgi:hypothetical protein
MAGDTGDLKTAEISAREAVPGWCGEEMTMGDDALQAEVERLKAENAALKARATRGVSIKVSEKGGVSVYGLGRFPVTLYKEQWAKLLEMADDIRAFLKEHDAQLKSKDPR